MRIVKELTVANIKCTLFNHQQAFSVKMEIDRLEQIIKFREDSLSDELAIVAFLNSPKFQQIIDNFKEMGAIRNEMIELDEAYNSSDLNDII